MKSPMQVLSDGLKAIDEFNNDEYQAADHFTMQQLVDCIKETNGIKGIRVGESCEDQVVGEKLTVHVSSDESPSGVQMKYTLSKTTENNFSIGINPFFYLEDKKNDDFLYFSTKDHRKIMRDKMQGCFNKIGDMMIGNNKKMSFHLDSTAPTVAIGDVQHDLSHRSNSTQYNTNIKCSSIIHEVLHLVGLCDEYPETDKYPERVISRTSNLMHWHTVGFGISHGNYILARCTEFQYMDQNGNEIDVDQNILDAPNRLVLSSSERRVKDVSSYKVLKYKKEAPLEDVIAFNREKAKIKAAKKECIKFSENDGDYLSLVNFDFEIGDYVPEKGLYVREINDFKQKVHLRVDQINTILYPLCKEKNQKYYTCSSYAYLKNKGGGNPAPAYCKEMFAPPRSIGMTITPPKKSGPCDDLSGRAKQKCLRKVNGK